MNTQTRRPVREVLSQWQAEDQELGSLVDQLRQWMHEVEQLGIPHFGETATRLRPVRQRLVSHFSREGNLIEELSKYYPSDSPEMQAIRRQSEHDHRLLLHRLDDLIDRLDQTDPPFESWQSAIDEVELFVDTLEQHEEQEFESFATLIPASDVDSNG